MKILPWQWGYLVLMAWATSGCSTSRPPEPTGTVADPSPIDFAGWPALTEQPVLVPGDMIVYCRPPDPSWDPGPHGAHTVQYRANPSAYAALKSGARTLPVGAVVVKEKFRGEPARPDGYAAMIKREAGFDPEHGDWEYVHVRREEESQVVRGQLTSCRECHRRVAATDYLFRTYLSATRSVSLRGAP